VFCFSEQNSLLKKITNFWATYSTSLEISSGMRSTHRAVPLGELSTNEKGGSFFGSILTNKRNSLHKEIEIWLQNGLQILGMMSTNHFFWGFEGQQVGWWWW
jgi:hypothetical protein